MENQELVTVTETVENNLTKIDRSISFSESSQLTMVEFIRNLVKSRTLPEHVIDEATALYIISMGKEMGLTPIMSLQHITPVKGKLTLSADAQAALMLKHGLEFKVIYDGCWMYGNGEILYSQIHPETIDSNGNAYGVPHDRVTKLEVTRNGVVHKVLYTWSDAVQQGLTGKNNWEKLPREMLMARAKTKARTQVAPDILFGLPTTDEMFDTLSVEEQSKYKVKRNDFGTITELVENP